MAHFEGSIKEFTKFIGAYARIKVMHISSIYKKQLGKCEECNDSSALDAAHIKGKERSLLIANILSQFIEDDIVRIDLNEFEERFVKSHLPIESSIRILCKACHRNYDKKLVEQSTPKEQKEESESIMIENFVNNQMNKTQALKIAYSKGLTTLTNVNTIFSNIISVQAGWWLQPRNDKFKTILHIILSDSRSNQLYIFKLPANTIANPADHFKQRNDKFRTNCSDIYIPTSGTTFMEKNGFNFSPFLIENISYTT